MQSNSFDLLKKFIGVAYNKQQELNKERIEKMGQRMEPGKSPSVVNVNPALVRYLYACFIGIISIVSVDLIKVIFRKNFGPGGINILCLAVSCFLFFVFGVVLFYGGIAYFFGAFRGNGRVFFESEGGSILFVCLGVSYIFIAIYTFKKGLRDYNASKTNNRPKDYQGDSILFASLEKEGWSVKKIQWLAEPGATVLVGICVCLFNIPGGIPIIACGLLFWVYGLIDYIFLRNNLAERVDRMESNKRNDGGFNDINTGM